MFLREDFQKYHYEMVSGNPLSDYHGFPELQDEMLAFNLQAVVKDAETIVSLEVQIDSVSEAS
jgi:hypothetical protein